MAVSSVSGLKVQECGKLGVERKREELAVLNANAVRSWKSLGPFPGGFCPPPRGYIYMVRVPILLYGTPPRGYIYMVRLPRSRYRTPPGGIFT